MDKFTFKTADGVDVNLEKLSQAFPEVITETMGKDGKIKRVADFEKLKMLLGDSAAERPQEFYEFTWPGKNEAIFEAAKATTKTLRPCPEESKNWDTTQNLYIEGDNLEALKILQEAYLGKVKMIYIDPPYNTGKDFVYRDNFHKSAEEGKEDETVRDEETDNNLFQNTESNGRFHSDWCSMIYPRLKLSRDLLRDDGVIFISIDDNEVHNLRKICDEIFGEDNFYGMITWLKKRKGSFLSKGIISLSEYVLVFSKNKNSSVGIYGGTADTKESQPIIKRTNKISNLKIPGNIINTKLPDGIYKKGIYGDEINPITLLNDAVIKDGKIINEFSMLAPFVWSQQMFNEQLNKGARFVINTLNFQIRVYRVHEDDSFKGFGSIINGVEIKGTNEDAYEELKRIFDKKSLFDYSKPINYIKSLEKGTTYFDKDAIILDFFSGSATTAHACMQLNAEDGGNRKFIMVQLPEVCAPDSEAAKAGYKNICEIGKERIRRAGEKIKAEHATTAPNLDIGFRVLKLDESNMKEVYYKPDELSQDMLSGLESNIKEDRNDLDLLYACLIDWGVELALPLKTEEINGVKVYTVNDNEIPDLIASFSENITEATIREIAKRKPLRVIFRDSSFADSPSKINVTEIFKTLSPNTTIKVL